MAILPQVITEDRASAAQVIDGSLVFNGDDQYLTKTFASAGNRQKFSFSFWAKRTEYGVANMGIFCEYPGSGNGDFIRFSDDDSGDTFRFYSDDLSTQSLVTKRKFRDTGWYHICVAVDTTQATDTDRVKIYINGERNVDWASATWPSQDAEYDFMSASAHYIGRCQSGSYFPGSLSQFYVIDGQTLDPFYFGYTDPLTNTWRPKKYSQRSGPNDGTVWSSGSYNSVTGTTGDTDMSNAFDGDLTTYTSLGSGDGSCTSTVVFTPPNSFQNVTGLRVYMQVDRGQTISVNGIQTNASVAAGWNDTGFKGNVNNITIGPTSSGSSSNINAIEIDGVILKDSTTINGVPADYNITAGGDSIVSGATVLTWDDSPIGNYDLTNSDKTATTNDGGTGYANADVWSIAIAANTTYAWTLDITNGDSTGGWYFTDSQTASGTHADERGGNSCGLRGGETSMGTHGTFATANGTSSGQSQISVNSAVSPNGTKKIDFVVYRPSSGDGKVWIRGYGASSWLGGGDPTNTSSTATFAIPDGTTYFGMTAYSRGTAQVLTFDELVTGPTGVNSFYLPLDGSGPIGRDQSGNANDWTPVNFGGSTLIPKATGALPTLNTVNGGNVAAPGVRGQAGIAVTVFDSGSGDKFYLDGVETPSLEQYRGQTVTFNLSDSTCASHPLRLSTTSDGTHGGGSEYSEGKQEGGTPGSVGAATTITYPYTVADTLYYYCPNHSAMGGSVELSTDVQKADPYAWRNVLALPLVDATDVGIACTLTPKTITANGDAAASSATANFYSGSYLFDGTGDYLSSSSSADLTFGTGDFTIECWVYMTAASSAEDGIFQISTTSGGLAATQTDTLTLQTNSGVYRSYANDTSTAFSTAVITDEWVHLALVRSSGSLNLFVNGIKDATTISDTRDYSGTYLCIGGYYSTGYLWVGNISDFRVYKGVVKYTNDFIPASTNPDILPNTPSGIAYGSDLTKVTDGAVTFDGTGDYLTLPNSTDTNFGSGDFTVECWAYFTDVSGSHTLLGQWENGSARRSWLLQVNTGVLSSYLSADGSTSGMLRIDSATASIGENKWYHLAYARSGDTMRMFVDGVLVGTDDATGFTNYANTDDTYQVLSLIHI